MQRIGLEQHALKLQAAEQFLECCFLTGFMGVVGLLGYAHAESVGVDGDLCRKTVVAVLGLDGRAP